MLIIFDLDDTLIDTSGCVTPFKLKQCLTRLAAEGLPLGDLEEAYQELLAMNAKVLKSKDAIAAFVLQKGGDAGLIAKGIEELFTPLPADFSVATTPNAKEILKTFKKSHTLALVTGGHPPFQMEKLEKAGIDRAFFSKIAIPEDSIKKPFYEGLLKEFSLSPHEVLVCGDRIAMDLVPAFELGITTVHMRWGRGKQTQSEEWINHRISDLSELTRIIGI